MIVVVVYANMS